MSPAPNPSLPLEPARRPPRGGPAPDGSRGGSRIAAARARLERAKAILACAAVAVFGVSVLLVRGNHAGASIATRAPASTVRQPTVSTPSDDYYYYDDSGFDSSGSGFSTGGTIAPSQSTAPVVTSGGS